MDPISSKKSSSLNPAAASSKIVPFPLKDASSQSSLKTHPEAKKEQPISFWEGLKRFFASILYCLSCQWLCIKSKKEELPAEKEVKLDLQECQKQLDAIKNPSDRSLACQHMIKEILAKQASCLTRAIEKWGKKVPGWMPREKDVEIPAKALEGHVTEMSRALDFCASLYPFAASPATPTDKELAILNPFFIKNAKITFFSHANIVLMPCSQAFTELMRGKDSSEYASLQKVFKQFEALNTKMIIELGRIKDESYARNVRIALGKE